MFYKTIRFHNNIDTNLFPFIVKAVIYVSLISLYIDVVKGIFQPCVPGLEQWEKYLKVSGNLLNEF